ncbi:MAG TPA: hypothetical protein VFQ53_07375 [Kofleriaceae bacterium]|nr:hypothetical protein [Kofleriaceae bacterium]
MRRREVLWLLGGVLVACHTDDARAPDRGDRPPDGATDATTDAAVDACTQAFVTMHDTYAQALYLDGSLGPLTGIVEVAFVVAGVAVTLDFWHGHDGELHRYTLEPAHLEALRRGDRVTLETTLVAGHRHMLFVDPVDPAYRVPGAPDVEVAVGCVG